MTNSLDNRAKKARLLFPKKFYGNTRDLSTPLLDAMESAGAIRVFGGTQTQILRWFARLSPELKRELLIIGVKRACVVAKKQYVYGPGQWATQRKAAKKVAEVKREKARAFDRIVEMLDHLDVNGKVLGDCTRADLLRAAVQLDQQSEDAKVRAAMYRELASIVGKGTVREASNRGQIVALLTTTFKEAA